MTFRRAWAAVRSLIDICGLLLLDLVA